MGPLQLIPLLEAYRFAGEIDMKECSYAMAIVAA
jgi:hypothetical protein